MAYGTFAVDTIQSSTTGTPTQFNDGSGNQIGTLCRAWVNFNGTSGSVAIRASFNVSSIVYNSAGDYTINFTNALPDANYSVAGTPSGDNNARARCFSPYGATYILTTSVRIASGYSNTSYSDSNTIGVAIFR